MHKYTIWLCCKQFETFDTKIDAFENGYSWNNSDYPTHRVQYVEGHGEDLTSEFTDYCYKQDDLGNKQYAAQRAEAKSNFLGTVEVKSPSGTWCPERVYSPSNRDKLLSDYKKIFGPDRVRFIEK